MHTARRLLEEWLTPPSVRFIESERDDLVAQHQGHRFVVEYKASSDAASVRNAIEQVRKIQGRNRANEVPLIAVSYMGEVGREICKSAGISWFDLSGNAHIVAPGTRIIVSGNANAFKRSGRPGTAFAPKSARITRRLLIEPERAFRQKELAEITGLDDGYTSRIVNRLVDDGLVQRDEKRSIRVKDPALLLDAWSEAYDFGHHSIIRGHITARESYEMQTRIARAFSGAKTRFAATGLGAAWLYNNFSAFRLVTMFVEHRPSEKTLSEMGFREEAKGANVWLVVPDDIGVFDGSTELDGVTVVDPVQAYVDLQSQPERAKEAAEELRKTMLARGHR